MFFNNFEETSQAAQRGDSLEQFSRTFRDSFTSPNSSKMLRCKHQQNGVEKCLPEKFD